MSQPTSKNWLYHLPSMKHTGKYANNLAQLCQTKLSYNIVKNNIPHTPSKVCVLQSITFSHIPDEVMSAGLAKACVPWKIYSVIEKLSFIIVNQREWEAYIHLYIEEI